MVTVEFQQAEKVHRRAKKAKAPIDSPLSERPYGTASMITDADSYVVRFLHLKGVFA
jgi:hypothetical protein